MCLRVDSQNASYPPFTLYLCETCETFDQDFRFAPLNETLSINPITVDCFNPSSLKPDMVHPFSYSLKMYQTVFRYFKPLFDLCDLVNGVV